MRLTRRWLEMASLVAGAWLFGSPWLFGFTAVTVATWSAYILGAVVVLTALWAMSAREARNPDIISAIVGALVFISPWVLAFTVERVPTVDAWIVGAVVVVASLWAAMGERPSERPERRRPTV